MGRAIRDLKPVDLAKAKNDVRTTLLQGIGGLLLIAGAIATWRQLRLGREQLIVTQQQMRISQRLSQRQLELSLDGQITERFAKAIEQLGSSEAELRLGGIYSLQRIGRNSDLDRKAIIDVLTAYIRQRSPWPPKHQLSEPDVPAEVGGIGSALILPLRIRAADIYSALIVLIDLARLPESMGNRPSGGNAWPALVPFSSAYQRREEDQEEEEARWEFSTPFALASQTLSVLERPVTLAHAPWLGRVDLRAAALEYSYLRGFNLVGSNLEGSNLRAADLRGAFLRGVNFRGAVLVSADLRGADLMEFKSEESIYVARLAALFKGADLRDADLTGAKLNEAKLTGAIGNRRTKWPNEFNPEAAGIVMVNE